MLDFIDEAQFEAAIAADRQRFRGEIFPSIEDYDFAKLFVFSGQYGLEPFEFIERLGALVSKNTQNWRNTKNESKFNAILLSAGNRNSTLERIDNGLKSMFDRAEMQTALDGRKVS